MGYLFSANKEKSGRLRSRAACEVGPLAKLGHAQLGHAQSGRQSPRKVKGDGRHHCGGRQGPQKCCEKPLSLSFLPDILCSISDMLNDNISSLFLGHYVRRLAAAGTTAQAKLITLGLYYRL